MGKSEHAKAKEKRCKVGFVQICFYSGAVISRAETKYIPLGEIYPNNNSRTILLSSSLPASLFGACASIIFRSLSKCLPRCPHLSRSHRIRFQV